MTPKYIPPSFNLEAFHCMHTNCGVFAKQGWGQPNFYIAKANNGSVENVWACRCSHCLKWSFWVNEVLVFPLEVTAPKPNVDLPAEIKADYEEARLILAVSPRGAAALLRLCIQKLCKHLGESGENINSDISSLVKKGLPVRIQQALDIVRVVGNNAVHPGQLDLTDNAGVARQIFGLVNIIAEVMISQPKHIDELFNTVVPESQRNAITKRDGDLD